MEEKECRGHPISNDLALVATLHSTLNRWWIQAWIASAGCVVAQIGARVYFPVGMVQYSCKFNGLTSYPNNLFLVSNVKFFGSRIYTGFGHTTRLPNWALRNSIHQHGLSYHCKVSVRSHTVTAYRAKLRGA